MFTCVAARVLLKLPNQKSKSGWAASSAMMMLLLYLPLVAGSRSVSWWFSIAENTTTDAANMAYLASLPKEAVTRVMPDMGAIKGDGEEIYDGKPWTPKPGKGTGIMYGDAWVWWLYEKEVATWYPALRKAVPDAKICPWILDTSNATMFHEKVLKNATAFISDAVAIAKHYGFDGWHIDYEDERPSDSYPDKHDDLRKFLKQFADALHAEGKELVFDVAGWSSLLSNYTNIAASGIDQLQDMSFYARPGSYKEDLASFYSQVKASNPTSWATQAGVGIGVYYDGHNGYSEEWTENNTRAFLSEVIKQGGEAIDIFRLCRNTVDDWPRADWWATLIAAFATGTL